MFEIDLNSDLKRESDFLFLVALFTVGFYYP